jgi:hypothetical protein
MTPSKIQLQEAVEIVEQMKDDLTFDSERNAIIVLLQSAQVVLSGEVFMGEEEVYGKLRDLVNIAEHLRDEERRDKILEVAKSLTHLPKHLSVSEIEKIGECASCKAPLERYCLICKKLWES